jgi:hypothetical protein
MIAEVETLLASKSRLDKWDPNWDGLYKRVKSSIRLLCNEYVAYARYRRMVAGVKAYDGYDGYTLGDLIAEERRADISMERACLQFTAKCFEAWVDRLNRWEQVEEKEISMKIEKEKSLEEKYFNLFLRNAAILWSFCNQQSFNRRRFPFPLISGRVHVSADEFKSAAMPFARRRRNHKCLCFVYQVVTGSAPFQSALDDIESDEAVIIGAYQRILDALGDKRLDGCSPLKHDTHALQSFTMRLRWYDQQCCDLQSHIEACSRKIRSALSSPLPNALSDPTEPCIVTLLSFWSSLKYTEAKNYVEF